MNLIQSLHCTMNRGLIGGAIALDDIYDEVEFESVEFEPIDE